MPILGIIVPPISDVTFLMDFGSRQALPGRVPQGADDLPAPVFFNMKFTIPKVVYFDVSR